MGALGASPPPPPLGHAPQALLEMARAREGNKQVGGWRGSERGVLERSWRGLEVWSSGGGLEREPVERGGCREGVGERGAAEGESGDRGICR
eukprot:7445917-Pyramimonas_sp.AAC.1